ncbi:MAG: DNA polymerase III subunit chi [Pseudomonadota bacterium]
MTNIDFYILEQQVSMARLHFLCRLTEKALSRQHRIVIAVDDESEAQTLSEYLWCFKPESFLAHQTERTLPHQQKRIDHASPIQLVWDKPDDHHHDILINIGQQIPDNFSQFNRVIEIVVQEEDCLRSTRQHFQFYRDRGYPLKSHTVEG